MLPGVPVYTVVINLTVFDEGVVSLDELPGLVQQDLHPRGLVLVAQLRLQIGTKFKRKVS
jgi:hypothetical protein